MYQHIVNTYSSKNVLVRKYDRPEQAPSHTNVVL
jgi:hypothetical protein